jgi:hypothetical protein
LTAVAPIVRFNAFDIFETPVFFFASDFSSRTSEEVHARRDTAFFLFGIPRSFFCETAFYHAKLALQRALFAAFNINKFSMRR